MTRKRWRQSHAFFARDRFDFRQAFPQLVGQQRTHIFEDLLKLGPQDCTVRDVTNLMSATLKIAHCAGIDIDLPVCSRAITPLVG